MYGDTTAIRALARDLRTRADEIRDEADRLRRLAERVPWEGRAADAMRGHAHDRTTALRRTARLHDDAADALDRHAREVDRLHALIAAVERRVRGLLDGVVHRVAHFHPPPPGSRDWLTLDLPWPWR